MTDIVERLREEQDAYELCHEAADEIERLRSLLEAKTTPGYELLAGTIEEKDAEIERLRELFRIDGEQHTASVKTILHDQDTRLAAYKNEIERLRKELDFINTELDKLRRIMDEPP